MKAVICPRYGPPDVLVIKEVPKPVPKKNEVMIKVKATSVTVADRRIRSFDVPRSYRIPARLMLGIFKPRQAILGVELAGEIESVGCEVKNFRPGEKVFCPTLRSMGGYAEYKCMKADGPLAYIPNALSFEEAATIPIGAGTALYYLKKVKDPVGKHIMIYGASGSVGTYAVQMAKSLGLEVTAVCSAGNFELVKSLGADKTLDYRDQAFPGSLEMYDVILVAIDKLDFSICKDHIKPGGTFMNITRPFKSRDMKRAARTGIRVFVGESPPETAAVMNELGKMVEEGMFKPVLDKTYHLEEIADAHRYVDTGRKRGNVAISVSRE